MSREIKFRAWHKYQGILANVSLLNINGKVHVSYQKGEEKSGFFFGGNWVGDDWENDQHVLMQYTGKNDVKNIPVYEGDLVKIANTVYHVYWKTEECAFKLIHAKGQGDDYGVFTRNILNEPWEITGNIFQNPELLTP